MYIHTYQQGEQRDILNRAPLLSPERQYNKYLCMSSRCRSPLSNTRQLRCEPLKRRKKSTRGTAGQGDLCTCSVPVCWMMAWQKAIVTGEVSDSMQLYHVCTNVHARRGCSQNATYGSRNPDILPYKCMKIEYDKICWSNILVEYIVAYVCSTILPSM